MGFTIKESFISMNDEDQKNTINEMAVVHFNDVGMTYEWLSALWESHYPGKDLPALEIMDKETGKIQNLIPFYYSKKRIRGFKVKMLNTLANLYSTRAGLYFPDDKDSEQSINLLLDHFFKTNAHLFQFILEKGSVPEILLGRILKKKKIQFKTSHYDISPTFKMDQDYETWFKSKSGNFRSNLKRKEKKLLKQGELEIEILDSPKDLNRVLEAVFAVEDSSWKIKTGTAITSENRRKEFYTVLSRRMAEAGWLRIYLLKLGGRPVAFDFGLFFNRRYFMLKTSYVESLSHLSPGIVLRWYVVKDLFRHNCLEHDFMWGEEAYKLQWANSSRQFIRMTVYNKQIKSHFLYLSDFFAGILRKNKGENHGK